MRKTALVGSLFLLGLVVVQSAQAEIKTFARTDGYPPRTQLVVRDGDCVSQYVSCGEGVFRVFHKGRLVDVGDLYFDYQKTQSTYYTKWSCKHTGVLTWTATFDRTLYGDAPERQYDDDEPPEQPVIGQSTDTVEGPSFKVPRCTPWAPYNVARATAAGWASSQWESEFVSRVDCGPNARKANWYCLVDHNNTYRQCTTGVGLAFRKRIKLGEREKNTKVSLRNRGCFYF